jgi:hypothetical protein
VCGAFLVPFRSSPCLALVGADTEDPLSLSLLLMTDDVGGHSSSSLLGQLRVSRTCTIGSRGCEGSGQSSSISPGELIHRFSSSGRLES